MFGINYLKTLNDYRLGMSWTNSEVLKVFKIKNVWKESNITIVFCCIEVIILILRPFTNDETNDAKSFPIFNCMQIIYKAWKKPTLLIGSRASLWDGPKSKKTGIFNLVRLSHSLPRSVFFNPWSAYWNCQTWKN